MARVVELAVIGLLGLASMGALGDAADSRLPPPDDADVLAGDRALGKADWAGAIAAYTKALGRPDNARNADIWNKLGFVTRSAGKAQESIAIYTRALNVDPFHKGAHEYAGEAFLSLGDVANAKFHLARLDALCPFGCVELVELKAKIAAFEAGKRQSN